MKVCIHRGAHEIGGTCIAIESQGKRLVLDIGQPLDYPDPFTRYHRE
jgi:ribonuclease J